MMRRLVLLLALSALLLQGCTLLRRPPEPSARPAASLPKRTPRNLDSIPDAVPRKEPRSRYGNPETYEVFGRTYRVQRNAKGHVERGVASWYGPGFHAERTSSGESYDMYAMTAAHKTLPIPVYARVTNLENGLSVVVRINDRGPFVGDRIIDLSYTAAHKLDMTRKGTAMVEVRVIEPGDDSSPPPLPRPIVTTSTAGSTAPAGSGVGVTPSARLNPQAAIGVSSRFLQAGSFSARENAEAMRQRLADSGIRNTLVREALIGDRTVYRVQVGPLAGGLEADDMIERLRIAGIPDARPAHE
ncbi:MAG: septal ring lytic transglycosylase RlpA family protein [Gammaproteobacteria bacterium]|nr:septal ring lytic transglycosylase RlpA family protein [Gammaproteobacteria bacterium]